MDKKQLLKTFSEKRQRNAELDAVLNDQFSPKDAAEIRKLIANYFWNKVTEEMEVLAIEKGWTQETYEQWANDHFRTPYEGI
jgi:hypothetical protein